MIELFNSTTPLKGNANKKSLCTNCIHKCSIKNVTLCNIETNPSIFYHKFISKSIQQCEDYCPIDKSYPKLNVHSIWDWRLGFVHPTPIILVCKHEKPEYEQPSINELLLQVNNIANGYNIKLKGFPWVINLGEISENNKIKLYRTNLLSDEEINNILKKINK